MAIEQEGINPQEKMHTALIPLPKGYSPITAARGVKIWYENFSRFQRRIHAAETRSPQEIAEQSNLMTFARFEEVGKWTLEIRAPQGHNASVIKATATIFAALLERNTSL